MKRARLFGAGWRKEIVSKRSFQKFRTPMKFPANTLGRALKNFCRISKPISFSRSTLFKEISNAKVCESLTNLGGYGTACGNYGRGGTGQRAERSWSND